MAIESGYRGTTIYIDLGCYKSPTDYTKAYVTGFSFLPHLYAFLR